MKPRMLRALVLVSMMVCAAAGEGAGPDMPLRTLQGTMVTMVNEEDGFVSRFWAKGSCVRSELAYGEARVVVLQRSNTLHIYMEGVPHTGIQRSLGGPGLGSLPLLAQLEEVKARGVKGETILLAGEAHARYDYGVHAPHELSAVFLNERTGLPRLWVSSVTGEGGEPSFLRVYYRDLQANGDIPDSLFELPPDVVFKEEPAPAGAP